MGPELRAVGAGTEQGLPRPKWGLARGSVCAAALACAGRFYDACRHASHCEGLVADGRDHRRGVLASDRDAD
jgi:hypothetical protein